MGQLLDDWSKKKKRKKKKAELVKEIFMGNTYYTLYM